MTKPRRRWFPWLLGLIATAAIGKAVDVYFPAVIDGAGMILAAVIGWFNLTYVLLGVGGGGVVRGGGVYGDLARTYPRCSARRFTTPMD